MKSILTVIALFSITMGMAFGTHDADPYSEVIIIQLNAKDEFVCGAACLLPSTVNATIGERIEWVNQDITLHHINGVFTDGTVIKGLVYPSSRFDYTFNTAGQFDYSSDRYPWLKGTVFVYDPNPPAPVIEEVVEVVEEEPVVIVIEDIPVVLTSSSSDLQLHNELVKVTGDLNNALNEIAILQSQITNGSSQIDAINQLRADRDQWKSIAESWKMVAMEQLSIMTTILGIQ